MVGRIYHVGLTVSDLERSIAFYRNVLGLEFQGEIFMEGEETDKMFRRVNCKANRYGRVLFLREYASYIKDSMVAELTDMNRNLMMSIDIVPVPTDEAVKEAEPSAWCRNQYHKLAA